MPASFVWRRPSKNKPLCVSPLTRKVAIDKRPRRNLTLTQSMTPFTILSNTSVTRRLPPTFPSFLPSFLLLLFLVSPPLTSDLFDETRRAAITWRNRCALRRWMWYTSHLRWKWRKNGGYFGKIESLEIYNTESGVLSKLGIWITENLKQQERNIVMECERMEWL